MYDTLEYRKDRRMPALSSPEIAVGLSFPQATQARPPAVGLCTAVSAICQTDLKACFKGRRMCDGHLTCKSLLSRWSLHALNAFAPMS